MKDGLCAINHSGDECAEGGSLQPGAECLALGDCQPRWHWSDAVDRGFEYNLLGPDH